MSRTCAVALLAALALTLLFWLPLWQGGGFVGGDVYSYYLPQKVYYAEALAAGEFPLWHNRTGFGYPLVAESQAGPFYPFHLLFYRFLAVNTAYNANHLLHYALAFVFAWLFARCVGLNRIAAGLAALVYVYGWFPSRSCWEWAIIGGTWLPAALLCVEQFLKTRRWRYLIALSAVLALQLFAGHYNIAFITLVALSGYVPLRLWFAHHDLPQPTAAARGRAFALLFSSIALGLTLAAVQLFPTWELKGDSQRAAAGEHHKLAHGSIPAKYTSQLVLPWQWYSVDIERDFILEGMSRPLGAKTNQVEAHLYFGLVPLGLALLGLIRAIVDRNRTMLLWFCLGCAALVYAWGWLLPVTQYLPGFNFFQGPGRFGIVTTLAAGLLAGYGLETVMRGRSVATMLVAVVAMLYSLFSSYLLADETAAATRLRGQSALLQLGSLEISGDIALWLLVAGAVATVIATLFFLAARSEGAATRRRERWATAYQWLLGTGLFTATILDLWIVSRIVTYSPMVEDPPITHLAESPLHRILAEYREPPRLLAPGANLPTLLGVSSVPVYLTFAPREYVDPELSLPTKNLEAHFAWLNRASVTHRLEPVPKWWQWPSRLVWQGVDPLLNPALGRFRTPYYLYELEGTRRRASWTDADAAATARITNYRANDVTIEAQSASGGRLVLTDLMSRGWTVRIDGAPAVPLRVERLFRGVDVPAGTHQVVWTYRPRSLYWGAAVSIAAFLLLAIVAHLRYWHPHRLRFFDEEARP